MTKNAIRNEAERKVLILRAKKLVRRYVPVSVSLSAELIAERRREAERE